MRLSNKLYKIIKGTIYDNLFKNPFSIRISSILVDVFSKRWNIVLTTTYLIIMYEVAVKAKIIANKICFFALNSKRYWLKFSI
jgi:hypothetical protein